MTLLVPAVFFDDGHEENGLSYRLNYSKRIDATNSQISLAAYRFSEREFHSYANFIAHQYNNTDTQDEKQTISISFNQPIDPLRMNLYISALRQQWWDGDSSTTASVTAGFNFDIGDWKSLSLSTSFSTTQYEESDNDNLVYLSLSVPFDLGRRLNYDMRNSSNTTHTLSWNDSSDPHNTWGVSAGMATDRPNNGAQFRGNYQHTTSAGELQFSGSYAASDYTSVSASWNGSMTATRDGIALHRRSFGNEPRVMVSTDGVADIPIQGNSDYTNIFGYAVVPMISSYQPSTIAVNMNDLPDGVTVDESITRETWTEGAIGYKSLVSRSGKNINIVIRLENGSYPPLGATIHQVNNNANVGMVSEDGHAWLGGVNSGQQFAVQWGEQQTCNITLPELLDIATEQLLLPCH